MAAESGEREQARQARLTEPRAQLEVAERAVILRFIALMKSLQELDAARQAAERILSRIPVELPEVTRHIAYLIQAEHPELLQKETPPIDQLAWSNYERHILDIRLQGLEGKHSPKADAQRARWKAERDRLTRELNYWHISGE